MDVPGVDENGVVHFTDKPPQAQPSTEIEVQDDYHSGEGNCSRVIHYLNTLKRQCPVFYGCQ